MIEPNKHRRNLKLSGKFYNLPTLIFSNKSNWIYRHGIDYLGFSKYGKVLLHFAYLRKVLLHFAYLTLIADASEIRFEKTGVPYQRIVHYQNGTGEWKTLKELTQSELKEVEAKRQELFENRKAIADTFQKMGQNIFFKDGEVFKEWIP